MSSREISCLLGDANLGMCRVVVTERRNAQGENDKVVLVNALRPSTYKLMSETRTEAHVGNVSTLIAEVTI